MKNKIVHYINLVLKSQNKILKTGNITYDRGKMCGSIVNFLYKYKSNKTKNN